MKKYLHATLYHLSRNRRLSFIARTSLLALLAVILPQCAGMTSHPLQGLDAPDFSLRLLDGGVLNLEEHLGKRPIVLDFWAVWCPACRAGIPKLAAVVEQFKDKDVVICSVNMGDSQDGIASFLKTNAVQIPVAMDERNAVGNAYQVRSIPTKVFIDREGKVSKVTVGTLTESAFSEAIQKLL